MVASKQRFYLVSDSVNVEKIMLLSDYVFDNYADTNWTDHLESSNSQNISLQLDERQYLEKKSFKIFKV